MDSKITGSGLINIGNSCFFNSSLQALFHIPIITKYLQEWLQNITERCECVACAFLSVYESSQSSQSPCNPSVLYSVLRKTNKYFLNILNGFQQDAHEFLLLFIDEMRQQKHWNLSFDDIFNADLITEIECPKCKQVSKSFSNVGELCLDISGKESIENALHTYFDNNSAQFNCKVCKMKVNANKKFLLESAPQCLMITLQRFTSSNEKQNNHIHISRKLSLTKYFSNKPTREFKYNLVAIINHIGGNINQGHYNTISCSENDVYYRFDDGTVSRIDANGVAGNHPYILFYEVIKASINDLELAEESIPIEIIDEIDPEQDMIQDEEKYVENEVIELIEVEESNDAELSDDGDWIPIEIIDDVGQTPDFIQEQESNDRELNKDRNPIEIIVDKDISRTPDLIQMENKLSGCRIIDIDYFFKQMRAMNRNICKTCKVGEMSFTKEIKWGLLSMFHFKCSFCGITNRVDSYPKRNNIAKINEHAVLGVVSIGSGFYHLQEFLAHLDITCMSHQTFHKLEKKLHDDWWNLAKQFEAEALSEEIRLAKESNEVDSAGNALIGVEFDGTWEKRAYTSNFTSLAGCATIIGLRTGKIVYSDVKSKYCHVCKIAQSKNTPPNKHKCNANYVGPSSGMETLIIVEGFKFCAGKGARFNYYIGDGDSSIYKALRDLRLYQYPDLAIEKYECINHLFRNFVKKFIALLGNTKFKLRGRKLINAEIGRMLVIGVRMAAKHWRESNLDLEVKYANLERDIMNAPLHYFGNHDKCQKYFCNKTTEPQSHNLIAELKDTNIFYEILDLCQHYFSNNSKSLIAGYCTNKSEGFNSLIAKTIGGKRVCNSLDGSYKSRTNISEVQLNTNGHSGSTFHKLVYGNILSTCVNMENTRKRKVEKNAIALKNKPKRRRFDGESFKKKDKKKHYGFGREDVDMETSAYELAKSRHFQKLNEAQSDRHNIQFNTRTQRNSSKWNQIRKNMLTSSYFGRILNVRSRKSYKAIVEEILYQNIQYSNTAEIRHQRIHEMEALKIFCSMYSHDTVNTCGIFIDAEFPFLGTFINITCYVNELNTSSLGATPFRLYGEDGIIMAKCPKKAFKKSIEEALAKNLIQFWIGPPNNRRLNYKSHWYYEIQGQLRISGRRTAYLVLYLGDRIFRIQEVERNDDFWKKEMQNELVYFYNEALIKEMVDPRVERGMDLREYNAETKTFE